MAGRFNHTEKFKAAFKDWCHQLLVAAYCEAVAKKSIRLDWEENDITAQLHEYIEINQFRLNKHIVSNVEHHLPNESINKERGFADKYSRIDMRFVVIEKDIEYKYFAEAKILKEHDSYLKRRYIVTGIDNFISGKYYNGCLIAYILEGNLLTTIDGLNKLLVGDNRTSEILTQIECRFHKEYYESKHDTIGVLKHFMFDFTKLNEGSPHA